MTRESRNCHNLAEQWILVLADDLTGALEVGAKFAGCGLTARVTTETSVTSQPQVDVLVVDTETRHMTASQAYEVVHKTSLAAARFSPVLIYKKTDSTLRGNIAAEFRALQAVFPQRSLIYAPAYPEMERTVRNGRLYVSGKPLHETEFASDPLNPVSESDVKAMLNAQNVVVLDGESSEEVAYAVQLVTETNPFSLAAGPAALAGGLAKFFGVNGTVQSAVPPLSRCLIVNGSLHPVSCEQVSFARAQGCFNAHWICLECSLESRGLHRALQVGHRARTILEASAFDALIVFGGDTAFGIHSALGAPVFEPRGEILPGLPLSRCGNLFWITKAGGFGTPDLICKIQRLLI